MLNWHYNRTTVNITRSIFKVIKNGLSMLSELWKAVKDIYGTISLNIERNELKDMTYFSPNETG